jgi:hypothetical protein
MKGVLCVTVGPIAHPRPFSIEGIAGDADHRLYSPLRFAFATAQLVLRGVYLII